MSGERTSLHTVEQFRLLNTPIGGAGSGAVRYAAAMYFYKKGQMSPRMLEIYRCCSKFDTEDPIDLARFEGVAIPDVCKMDKPT